jgi:hypothetical protein
MVLYVYLIVYHERRNVPGHWAILVTNTENGLDGQVYHAVGSPFHGYRVEVKPSYDLSRTRRRYTLVFLGCVDDSWLDELAGAAMSISAAGISSTPLDPWAVSIPSEMYTFEESCGG